MYDSDDYEHLQYEAEFADFTHYSEDNDIDFCEFYPDNASTDDYDFDTEMDEVFESELMGDYE